MRRKEQIYPLQRYPTRIITRETEAIAETRGTPAD